MSDRAHMTYRCFSLYLNILTLVLHVVVRDYVICVSVVFLSDSCLLGGGGILFGLVDGL